MMKVRGLSIDEGHFTEVDYPFTMKPNFSTPGSIVEISRREPLISFLLEDSVRVLLGFNATSVFEEYT